MTSSVTVLQALVWEKLSAYYQIAIKNLKKTKYISNKDDLRMELIV